MTVDLIGEIPKTQTFIVIEEAWTETLAGELFLFYVTTDTKGNRIMIVVTNQNPRWHCGSVAIGFRG